MTKNAPTVASTRTTNMPVASLELDTRSAAITDLHEHAVGEWPLGVQFLRSAGCERTADRAAVADDERREWTGCDIRQCSLDARGVLLERLAAGEAEAAAVALDGERARPRTRVLALDVGDQAALPLAAPRLREALVHDRVEADRLADDLGRLAGAAEVARVERSQAERRDLLRECARLVAAALVERLVDRALHAPLGVCIGLAVAGEPDSVAHPASPWKSLSVSARRPRRSVSSAIASAGITLPRLTPGPMCSMNHTCWCFWGASKMSCSAWSSCSTSSIRPSRGSPFGRYMPASPVARPSQMTFVAPAASASLMSCTQRYGASSAFGSFSPTSAKTV